MGPESISSKCIAYLVFIVADQDHMTPLIKYVLCVVCMHTTFPLTTVTNNRYEFAPRHQPQGGNGRD